MLLDNMIGAIKIKNELFTSSIVGNKCIVKCRNYEIIKTINCKWTLFLLIRETIVVEEIYYNIFLENIKYVSSDMYEFDIAFSYFYRNEKIGSISFRSLALTNFYNERFMLNQDNGRKEYFEHMYETINKSNSYDVQLSFGKYKFHFENCFIIPEESDLINNILPFIPHTVLTIEKEDGKIEMEDLCNLIKYVFNLNRFVTLNKYTKIDNCIINYDNSSSIVNIHKNYKNVYPYPSGFYISDFENSIIDFLESNGDFIKHSDNIYLFEEGKVYAFDIARVSGAFENIFTKYVEKEYAEHLNNIKKEIHYEELRILVNKFKEQYNLTHNNTFQEMYSNLIRFGTLRQKYEFILSKFYITMGIDSNKIKQTRFFYTPDELSTRFKNARHDISHGLEKEKTNWYGASIDLFFVQQLIYYIILKYKLNISDEKIKCTLNRIYYSLNIALM